MKLFNTKYRQVEIKILQWIDYPANYIILCPDYYKFYYLYENVSWLSRNKNSNI